MKKIMLIVSGVLMVAFIIGCIHKQDDTTLAAEIEENFSQISNLSVEQALSSNPYDYINNDYYENIVALGVPAVTVLEENYHNGTYSGLDSYIAALAIQDITGLNLYECTGSDWSTAEEFFEQWDTTIQNLSDTFGKIMDSDISMSNKIYQIEKYGVFGQTFLKKAKVTKNHTVEFDGKEVSIDEAIDEETVPDISKGEMKEVTDYLEGVVE